MRTAKEIIGNESTGNFFRKCYLSFKYFAENCLKYTSDGREIKIQPFQENWVRLAENNKILVIEAFTGAAKTEIMGSMYPLWLMFKNRNLRILLISKRLDQAKGNMLERMKSYIRDNEILKQMLIPEDRDITWNKEEIRTKNGHWCRVVPYSDSIRGYRADIIIPDEIDSYEETNIFFEHVTSRLHEGGRIIATSTPVGPTRLIAILKERAKQKLIKGIVFEKTQALVNKDGGKAYTCPPENVTYDMLKDCISIWPEMFKTKTILDKWGIQGKWNFMKNQMAEVLGDAEDAAYPMKYIMRSFDTKLDFTDEVDNDAEYFIGADFAISDGPKADFDCFTVVKKKHGIYYVVHSELWRGKDIPFKVERLVRLFERYNETNYGCTLVVDASNFGKEVERQILSRGVPVVPKNFHSSARKSLIVTLSQVMKSGAITIPRHPAPEYCDNITCSEYTNTLRIQLTGFLRVRTDRGTETFQSTAPHDDVAISLMLAIAEAVGHDIGTDDGPMQR